MTLLDHAEWLLSAETAGASGATEDAERCLADAETIFEELRARPWLERVRAVRSSAPSPAYAGGTSAALLV